MLKKQSQQPNSQLMLSFQGKPGRPTVKSNRRRKPKSVTLAPEVIDHFDKWVYQNDMSFSQGVEKAIGAFLHMMVVLERGSNDTKI